MTCNHLCLEMALVQHHHVDELIYIRLCLQKLPRVIGLRHPFGAFLDRNPRTITGRACLGTSASRCLARSNSRSNQPLSIRHLQ